MSWTTTTTYKQQEHLLYISQHPSKTNCSYVQLQKAISHCVCSDRSVLAWLRTNPLCSQMFGPHMLLGLCSLNFHPNHSAFSKASPIAQRALGGNCIILSGVLTHTRKFITELFCLHMSGAEEKEEILEGHSPDTTNTFRK